MKNGGHARAVEARATQDMALELSKRSCTPEEYDDQLVTRKSVNLDLVNYAPFFNAQAATGIPPTSCLRWRSRCAKGM